MIIRFSSVEVIADRTKGVLVNHEGKTCLDWVREKMGEKKLKWAVHTILPRSLLLWGGGR